jgi:hypothetical protein
VDTQGAQASRIVIATIMYDDLGRRTADATVAVRGEVLELDEHGSVVRRFDRLAWEVPPRSLDGDIGLLPTRPRQAAAHGRRRRG